MTELEAMKILKDKQQAARQAKRLDRSQWEECGWCNAKIYGKTKSYFRSLLAPATYIEELRDKLEDLTGDVYVEIPRRYCQNCGRPLTEEAWAELERRISQ